MTALPFSLYTPKVYDITCRTCVVTWDPPRDDAGADICSYIIEVANETSQWMEYGSVDAKTFLYMLQDLPENQVVSCRVKAVDNNGRHAVSDQRSFQLEGIDLSESSKRTFLTVQELKQLGNKITESFLWAVRSLNLIVEAVISSKVCSTFGKVCMLTKFLSNHIAKFTQHLQYSSEKIIAFSKVLSPCRDVLFHEKQSTETNLLWMKGEIENAKTDLEQEKQNLLNLLAHLRRAEVVFADADENTSRLRQRLAHLKEMSVGKAILFVLTPIVAQLANALTVKTVENELKASERNLHSAREHLQRNKESVRTCQELIKQEEYSIEQNTEKIEKEEKHIKRILQDLSYTEQTLQNLEKCRLLIDLYYTSTVANQPDAIIYQMKHVYDVHPGFTNLQTLALQLESPVLLCGFDNLKHFHGRIKMFDACETYIKAAFLEMGIDYCGERIAAVCLPLNSRTLQQKIKEIKPPLENKMIQEVPVMLSLFGKIFILSLKENKFFNNSKETNAVLRQLAKSGLEAFQTSSDIMLRIRILADQLSSEFNKALQTLSQSSPMDSDKTLSRRLNGIKTAVEKCISLSKEADYKFLEILKTITDLKDTLYSSSEPKDGQFKSLNAGVEQSLKNNVLEAMVVEKQKHARKLTEMRTKIKEAEQKYQNYINSAEEKQVFGLAVAQGLIYGTETLLLELFKPVQITLHTLKGIVADSKIGTYGRNKMFSQENEGIHRILTKIDSLLVHDATLSTCPSENEIEIFKVQIGIKNAGSFERCVRNLAICDGINLMHKHMQCLKHDLDPRDKMQGNRNVVREIEDVEILVKTEYTNNCTSFGLPRVKTEISDDSNGRNIVQAVVRKQGQSEQDVLSLGSQELTYENVSLTREENLEHVSDMLNKCLLVLAEIRQHWWNLLQYFERIRDLVDCSLHISVKKYSDVSTVVETERVRGGYSLLDFKHDMLTQETVSASLLLQTMQHTSSLYEDHFSRFFLHHAKSLRKLFTLRNKHVDNHYKQFYSECASSHEQIRKLMTTEK